MMGWRGQANRDDDAEHQWRTLPLRERYDWRAIGMTLAGLAVGGALVFLLR
jgi:hypothetical protein